MLEEKQSYEKAREDDSESFYTPQFTFFLFINSSSGGGLGNRLLSQQIRQISFQIPINSQKDIRLISVFFVDMKKNSKYGFLRLKSINQKKLKTIAIVCGGDGTVMWVIKQFQRYGINPLETPVGIIPTGTGNDFSRCLYWGAQKTILIENNFKSLKKLIRKWINAKQSQFDIWDITAETFPYGKLEKVQNEKDSVMKQKEVKKTFVNYFSFGIDGKIGYSFDKHRTASRIGNLAMYGAIGLVKQATTTKTIDELVESFFIKSKHQDKQVCVFKSKFKQQPFQEKTEYITEGLKNILVLNIDSYTGGVSGIWSSAKQIFKENISERTQPSFSDGKLQIVSFGSAMAIAMQRSIGGFANRIAQSQGPFIFKFRMYPETQKHRTYLQIDGQFIRITHPKRIIIEKSKLFAQGKIKVLINDPNFQPYIPTE